MLGGLAGVADRSISDPLVQVGPAVPHRARRDLDEVRATAAMPPVLQSPDGVAQDRRGFAFVDEVRMFDVELVCWLHFWFLARGWRCVCKIKDDRRTARKIVAENT